MAITDDTYGPGTPAWQALEHHAAELKGSSIGSLFEADPDRPQGFALEAESLYLDFSRQRLDAHGRTLLLQLAEQVQVQAWIERMFAGEHINHTEDRPALHVALRRPADLPLLVAGEDVMRGVEAERAKMRQLAEALHAGELKGYTGRPISDVVNIGIGGSDLGLVMAVEALAEFRRPGIGVHFISNIDGVQLTRVLARVDPETTLFVICSKSFTTLETLTNAQAVREWLLQHGGEAAVAAQFVAVSTNYEAMDAFGIAPDRRLALWDWVGGRYSLCSAVGLTLALAVGWEHFEALLRGAHAMDRHFEHTPPAENLPVLLALLGVWNRNFLGMASHAVLPYDYHLQRLPAYLQQLEMESNGKSVRRNGKPVECETCPVIWGEAGSNAQHSFYQLLHQGTARTSVDFLLPVRSGVGRQQQHDLAAANCLAQTWALAVGDPAGLGSDPHQAYAGNHPSSLIMFERLDPATLGKLIALYEHKVFVQSVIWDVNAFDQWGVELGKRLASELTDTLGVQGAAPPAVAGALAGLRAWRDPQP
jgi:glucose-6-phosphate isomerase